MPDDTLPTALVTGATAGLGREFARQLAARGHALCLVARDEARLRGLADELIERHGVPVHVLRADLATPEGLAAACDAVAEHRIDLLVNNAGSSLGRFFGDAPLADEDHQLDLLVRAPMHLCHAALAVMRPRGSGHVLNVASVAAYTPRGTYSAHKAWLTNLGRWLDIQYADEGVRTTTLLPGFVRTEFHERMGVDPADVPRWMWLSAERVVADALSDVDRGRAVSVPSRRYRVLATVARHAPLGVVAKVARRGRMVRP
ncbi:MAG: SDR family NAD(P)-dependent oxidoreductase [Nocardioidaceae bacterium]|nr:SDR family NAD(P)-dependent oxidoreductase [Nocardioidaceae bacterium]